MDGCHGEVSASADGIRAVGLRVRFMWIGDDFRWIRNRTMNEQLEEYIVWVLNALAMKMVEIFLEICCSIAGSSKFLVAWGNSPANTRTLLRH